MSLDVTEAQEGGVLVVSPAGRLDSVTAGGFEAQLLKHIGEGTNKMVLDFAKLDYISSAGLRVVLLAGKKLKAAGGKLALCELNQQIREVFAISGFITIFAVHPDRASAAAAIDG